MSTNDNPLAGKSDLSEKTVRELCSCYFYYIASTDHYDPRKANKVVQELERRCAPVSEEKVFPIIERLIYGKVPQLLNALDIKRIDDVLDELRTIGLPIERSGK